MPNLTDDEYLEAIFNIVGESVMLLNGRGSVEWIPADDEGDKESVQIDLAEFVLRSVANKLVDSGHPFEDVKRIAKEHGVEIGDESYFSVKFKRLGGKRRLTRRRQSKK